MARENDTLILVDENDNVTGWEEKTACHLNGGKLHRAFSIFIFNKSGELLLQQRANEKMLWGGFWSNTCCSHPRKDQNTLQSAKERLSEELGFTTDLTYLYKFIYKAEFKTIGTEYENCHVFYGYYDGNFSPDKNEIMDTKWISMKSLKNDIEANPPKYTPWFKLELQELTTKYITRINSGI